MSHYFNVEEIRTQLMIVTGMALSGEELCKRYRMGSRDNYKTYSLDEYKNLTKRIVSNILIETSVKTRYLLDSLDKTTAKSTTNKTIKIHNSGAQSDGKNENVDFRFICNKIIHAKSFNIDLVGKHSLPEEMVWWSGEITIAGDFNGKSWEFFFFALDWCDAVSEFLLAAEGKIPEN